MSVLESWQRIVAWYKENTYPNMLSLNAGATEEEIEAFQREIGLSLPDDFRESLLLHNGGDCGLLWYGELLTLDGVLRQWAMYKDWQRSGEYATADWKVEDSIDKHIRPVFWDSFRLPLTDNSGDHLMLDLQPASGGDVGQIFSHSHEVGPEQVLASSWSEFLTKVVTDLEAGKYVFVEEEDVVAPPGMYD